MRTTLLRLAALALLAGTGSVPAHADPIDDACVVAGPLTPETSRQCYDLGPGYDAEAGSDCTWIRGHRDDGTAVYVWYATVVARHAAEIRIECWQGPSYASQTTTGTVGLLAAPVDAPTSSDQICTRWSIRYVPGNPYGRDPNSFTTFAPTCYSPPPPIV